MQISEQTIIKLIKRESIEGRTRDEVYEIVKAIIKRAIVLETSEYEKLIKRLCEKLDL